MAKVRKLKPAEWQTCTSPQRMIEHLRAANRVHLSKPGRRKLLLFAIACCRRGWAKLKHDPTRPALEAAERFADGEIAKSTFERTARLAFRAVQPQLEWLAITGEAMVLWEVQQGWGPTDPVASLRTAVLVLPGCRPSDVWEMHATAAHGVAGKRVAGELVAQCELIRDIFGDPFRKSAFDRRWRTSTARGLAEAIYAERAFDRMPILADALEDAGCDDPQVLAHCRGEGPHVRGCWMVDLVRGKS